uniref:Uncharacterized protein n=1 Tax=Plectus sambesii TaxID=2011161 RepID=A0A914UNP7_9BILA
MSKLTTLSTDSGCQRFEWFGRCPMAALQVCRQHYVDLAIMQDVVFFCTQLMLMVCVWCKCCCCCCKLPIGKQSQRRLTAAREAPYEAAGSSSSSSAAVGKATKSGSKQGKNQKKKKKNSRGGKALVAVADSEGLYSAVHEVPFVTFRARPTRKALAGVMPVRYPGTDDDPIPYIDDADSDDDDVDHERYGFDSDDMKKGLKRRLFGDKRRDQPGGVSDSDGGNSSAVESDAEQRTTTKTSLLQKMFRKGGSSSATSSPVGSPATRRHPHREGDDDDNGHLSDNVLGKTDAILVDVNRPDSQHGSRTRELSVPLSPRSVTFADQVRRPGSAVPQSMRPQTTLAALDQAADDLLRLTNPSETAPTITFTGSLHPTLEELEKTSSTSSIPKVIRTQDGGMLKLGNVYTWNAGGSSQQNLNTNDSLSQQNLNTNDSLSQQNLNSNDSHSPGGQSGYDQSTTTSMLTTTVQVASGESQSGAPLVKTTVIGHLDMAQVVGAELVEVVDSVTDQWEIKDVTTQYKIYTKFPGRTIVFEDVENTTDDLSGINVTVSGANAMIASRADESTRLISGSQDTNMKSEYLTNLSHMLMEDVEQFHKSDSTTEEQRQQTSQAIASMVASPAVRAVVAKEESLPEEGPITTRIEVEITEDVTRMQKTYMVGPAQQMPTCASATHVIPVSLRRSSSLDVPTDAEPERVKLPPDDLNLVDVDFKRSKQDEWLVERTVHGASPVPVARTSLFTTAVEETVVEEAEQEFAYESASDTATPPPIERMGKVYVDRFGEHVEDEKIFRKPGTHVPDEAEDDQLAHTTGKRIPHDPAYYELEQQGTKAPRPPTPRRCCATRSRASRSR